MAAVVKCPKCGAEIDHLVYQEEKSYDAIFTITDEGKPFYDEEGADINSCSFCCPDCDEEVTKDEASAIELLKGG